MKEERQKRITAFFSGLDSLSTGDRATLKRAVGTRLCDADGRAMTIFYRLMPWQESETVEDRWFAAACFHCMWEAGSKGMALEKILARLKNDSNSMEHRLAALFDLRWEQDGYLLIKLSRIIKMVRQKDYCVDCASLLEDLLFWNADTQFVQRKWARAMYKIADSKAKEEERTSAV